MPVLARILAAAVAIAALSAVSAPCAAQGRTGAEPPVSVHEAFVPDLRARDVEAMIDALGLDDLQQTLVRARFAEWDEAFLAGRDEARRAMAALRPEIRADDAFRRALDESEAEMARIVEDAQARAARAEDPETRRAILDEAQRTIGEMRARLAEAGPPAGSSPEVDALMARMDELALAWMARKAELRESFLADVRALLTPEQAAAWPAYERDLRRRREIGRGRLAGEGVDLADLLRTLVPEPAPPVLEAAAAWAIAFDAALRRREEVLGAARRDGADPEAIVRAHRAVRDVNLEYARAIAAALGPDEGPRFARGFDELAFPRAMRPGRAQRILERAAALPDLADEQRAALRELTDRHAAERAAQNAAIAQEIVNAEPARLRRQLAGEPIGAPPERDLLAARDEGERSVLLALREILGADRYDALVGGPRSSSGRDDAMLPDAQRELLRRFDANGDGDLDAEERAALRRWLREHGG